MGEPDEMSRRPDHGDGSGDNKGMVLLPPDVFHIHAMRATLVRGPHEAILADIRQSLEQEGMTEEPVAAAARRAPVGRAGAEGGLCCVPLAARCWGDACPHLCFMPP